MSIPRYQLHITGACSMAYVQLQWVNAMDKADRGQMTASIPINIGRSPRNDLVLADKNASVSRRHARMIREDDHLVLIDKQSTNGIYVGERKITRSIVKSGTKFTIGAYLVTLKLQSQCSNQSCQRFVDNHLRLCPWCGRFLADAITREGLYE